MWLLLGLVTLVAATCTNSSSLVDASYLACQTNLGCMDAFYLSPAHHAWEKPRFVVLLNIVLGKIDSVPATICNSTQSFAVWLDLLASWNFCYANEVYDELSGDCICRPDKNCDRHMHGTLGGSTIAEWTLIPVLSLLFLYYASYLLTELRALHKPT